MPCTSVASSSFPAARIAKKRSFDTKWYATPVDLAGRGARVVQVTT